MLRRRDYGINISYAKWGKPRRSRADIILSLDLDKTVTSLGFS